MKNTVSKQAGNVIEWVILGIVLIGVVALIAWRYTDTDKDQNDAEQAGTSNIVTNNNDARIKDGTYSLQKWGVYADVPDALKNDAKDITAEYYVDTSADPDHDAYYLVSKTLKDAEFLCPKDNSFTSNGAFLEIQRSPNDPSLPGMTTVKVGNYYYWVMKTLQAVCYKDELMTKYFGPYAITVQNSIRTKAQN